MENTESITLRDILRIFFAHKAFFIVLPIVLTISAYIGSELRTPTYEAGVRMYIKAQKKTEAEFYRGIGNQNIVLDHLELLRSNTVLNRVVDALNLDERPVDYERKYATPLKKAFINYWLQGQPDYIQRRSSAIAALSANISVTPIKSSNLFYISVTDFDPRVAVKIANSVSRSYVMFDLEQQIEELKLKYGEKHSTVLQLTDYIREIEKTLNGNLIPDLEAIGPASVKIIAQAEGASMNVRVSRNFLMIFAFFTGIILAVMLSTLTEYMSNTIQSPRKIEINFRIPVLGSIPLVRSRRKLLIGENRIKQPHYVQSISNLAEELSLMMRDNKIKSVLVTDVEGSSETPLIIANVSFALAKNTSQKVLVIDADLRNSSLSAILGVDTGVGLADVLERKLSFMDSVQDMGNGLYLLPSGKTSMNPAVLLDSDAMKELLDAVREAYDMIFINCPDIKNFTYPAVLSSITEGLVFVINEGQVRQQVLDNALSPLRQKNINIMGAIFNNRTYVIPGIIYRIT